MSNRHGSPIAVESMCMIPCSSHIISVPIATAYSYTYTLLIKLLLQFTIGSHMTAMAIGIFHDWHLWSTRSESSLVPSLYSQAFFPLVLLCVKKGGEYM